MGEHDGGHGPLRDGGGAEDPLFPDPAEPSGDLDTDGFPHHVVHADAWGAGVFPEGPAAMETAEKGREKGTDPGGGNEQ